jgi:hypothetical protein
VTVTSTPPTSGVTRVGAGTDAWLVFRVRGDKAIFPVLTNGWSTTRLPLLVTGNASEVDLTLRGRGVHACAFTAPVFVDFDGGGLGVALTGVSRRRATWAPSGSIKTVAPAPAQATLEGTRRL